MSHCLVRLVIDGADPQDALRRADELFYEILAAPWVEYATPGWGIFDYYSTFEDHPAQGSLHFRDYDEPVMAGYTHEAREDVRDAFEDTTRQIERRYEKVVELLEDSSKDDIVDDFHARRMAGGLDPRNQAKDYLLYYEGDSSLFPVTTTEKFEDLLENMETKWVVPLDCHFVR